MTPAVLLASLITPLGAATASAAPSPSAPPLYPAVGAGTSFLDHDAKVAGLPDPAWYEANIPFVDLPDKDIESTFYYRWRTYKEALKYTGPADGWVVTEFLGTPGYAAPGGAISAAAGHHIYEGRWLRDQRYLDDYVDYWLTGAGSSAKPSTDGLGSDTTDWAHQYSFWAADAVLAKAKIDGDLSGAEALLPQLEKQWQAWAPQYNAALGLYWQTPVWDAMEFTASSYQSDDPYHGGAGYRPTLNAYQYGDANAISELARLLGDNAKADDYAAKATGLKAAQEAHLWDADAQFYKHVMRDGNPSNTKIADREEIGFIPWYFHMAPAENDDAWAQLLDPQGFKAPFGPTTVERRSPWFMHDALNGCCRWDGPSWPYATSQTLTAAGNLLADYPAQPYLNAADFTGLVHDYALTQRKNGKPYVAEAHHPDEDRWIYDGVGSSDDYNHSTFNDIVLGSLIGIKGEDDGTVRIAPQVDPSWDHFAAENVPYHGRNLTVLWDRDGSHYNAGAGLSVYVDGVLTHNQAALGDITVPVGPAVLASLPGQVDDAANPTAVGFPKASASYSNGGDPASEATDGQDYQLDIPKTRWTTYRTPNSSDWLKVDFGVATPVSDVRTTFYDDGGGVQVPSSYDVEYLTAAGDWVSLPGQTRSPGALVGGTVNRIVLDKPVVTTAIRMVGQKKDGAGGIGVTAFGSWRALDANLTTSIQTRADGSVAVTPGGTSDVVTTVVVGAGGTSPAGDQLYAPAGWKVERVSAPIPAGAGPGTYTSTWRVTVPAGAGGGDDSPLRYVVDSTTPGLGASTVGIARWVFDPTSFGHVVWDDTFSTDRLGEYQTSAGLGEPAPALTVNTTTGTLDVTATARARAHVQIPVPATSSFALIVEPKSFIDGRPGENSLFLGAAGSNEDFAMSWYNHSRSESGVNVVVDGQGKGDAEGGGSHPVTLQPGQRLATVVTDGSLSSWVEQDGAWRRISTAPVSVAIPPTTLAGWFPSLDVRLDAGTISLDRITVIQGGFLPVTPAAVTFADGPGAASDTYTVPTTAGVEYLVGDQVVAAGSHPGTGSVTVTARALSGYVLADGATSSWSFTFSNTGGSVANVAPPVVSGVALVGKQLTADPGKWDASGATFTYQWLRDGAAIAGATSAKYTTVKADGGKSLSVKVTATAANRLPGTAASAGVVVLFPATVKVSNPLLGISWFRVTVNVTVSSDGPVAGPVTVKVGNKTYPVTVDARGKGSVTLPNLKAGYYPVSAEFPGTATVAPAKSPTGALLILF